MKINRPLRDGLQHLHTALTKAMGSENFRFHSTSTRLAPALACFGSIRILDAVMREDLPCMRRMVIARVGAEHSGDWYHLRWVICPLVLAFVHLCIGVFCRFLQRWERVFRLDLRSVQCEALPPLIPCRFFQVSGLLLKSFSSVFVVLWSQFLPTMPRLRHQMRSRRGRSRGHPSGEHSSPSSLTPSLSSGLGTGHYPRTRSGRGCLPDFR